MSIITGGRRCRQAFSGVERKTEQLAVVNIVAAHERTDAEIVRQFVATMLRTSKNWPKSICCLKGSTAYSNH